MTVERQDDSLVEKFRYGVTRPLGAFLSSLKRKENLPIDVGFDFYAAMPVGQWEFACLFDADETTTEAYLKSVGFNRNPLASWKTASWWPGSPGDEGSWALWARPPRPWGAGGRWAKDYYSPDQLHVHLFELDGEFDTTAVFAHWEPSWRTRPVAHYMGHPPNYGSALDGPEMFLDVVDRSVQGHPRIITEELQEVPERE